MENTRSELLHKLIGDVITQIRNDFYNQDLTAIYELLLSCPIKNLIAFLPEEDWAEFKNLEELKN